MRRMTRILLSLILVAASVAAIAPCTCFADEVVKAGEQITNLPQDENKLYVTIFGDENDANFQTIKNWFSENEHLRAIKRQTHFQSIDTNSAMFQSRYAKNTPARLCIRVQAANGMLLHEYVDTDIPASSNTLARSMETKCFDRWRNRHCPKQEEPAPEINEEPTVEPEPAPEPPAPSFPWGVLAAVVAIGLLVGNAIGVAKKVKDTYQGKQ